MPENIFLHGAAHAGLCKPWNFHYIIWRKGEKLFNMYIKMKIPRKCHYHVTEPPRGIKRIRDNKKKTKKKKTTKKNNNKKTNKTKTVPLMQLQFFIFYLRVGGFIWCETYEKGPLCILRTTQTLISLRISAGWSGPLLSTYETSGFCSISRRTDNAQIRLHRWARWSWPTLSANCIRPLFMCFASYKPTDAQI